MGQYDVAQICENGHVITEMAMQYPQHTRKFCEQCGKPTLIRCPECGAQIPGDYHVPGWVGSSGFTTPRFCHACGKPYPWTTERLAAADELVDLADQLTDAERAQLRSDLPLLIIDSPRTQVATVRTRQVMAKIRNEAGSALRSVLTSVVTDAVKKGLNL